MLKHLIASFALLAVAVPSLARAESACDRLLARVKSDTSRDLVSIDRVYHCGPEFEALKGRKTKPVDGCAVVYREKSFGGQPDTTNVAFLDRANQFETLGATVRGDQASSWESSGSYLLSQVKAYFDVDLSQPALTVTVSREVGRDELFAVHYKVFQAYRTQCVAR